MPFCFLFFFLFLSHVTIPCVITSLLWLDAHFKSFLPVRTFYMLYKSRGHIVPDYGEAKAAVLHALTVILKEC